MPVGSLLTAGAGSTIPISAGGGTSGPATSGANVAPINIGGLFGSGARSSSDNSLVPTLIIGGVILAGIWLITRRR